LLDEGLRTTIVWYQDHRHWWERIKTGEYSTYYTTWYGERFTKSW
jgi:dTDP-glucose 4,6-dehydratase